LVGSAIVAKHRQRTTHTMKVICAGAPKTGTKSMAAALRILGYDAGKT